MIPNPPLQFHDLLSTVCLRYFNAAGADLECERYGGGMSLTSSHSISCKKTFLQHPFGR